MIRRLAQIALRYDEKAERVTSLARSAVANWEESREQVMATAKASESIDWFKLSLAAVKAMGQQTNRLANLAFEIWSLSDQTRMLEVRTDLIDGQVRADALKAEWQERINECGVR